MYAITYDGLGIQYELPAPKGLSEEASRRTTEEVLKYLNDPKVKAANELWSKIQAEKAQKEDHD